MLKFMRLQKFEKFLALFKQKTHTFKLFFLPCPASTAEMYFTTCPVSELHDFFAFSKVENSKSQEAFYFLLSHQFVARQKLYSCWDHPPTTHGPTTHRVCVSP
jgi:hypothetical protein